MRNCFDGMASPVVLGVNRLYLIRQQNRFLLDWVGIIAVLSCMNRKLPSTWCLIWYLGKENKPECTTKCLPFYDKQNHMILSPTLGTEFGNPWGKMTPPYTRYTHRGIPHPCPREWRQSSILAALVILRWHKPLFHASVPCARGERRVVSEIYMISPLRSPRRARRRYYNWLRLMTTVSGLWTAPLWIYLNDQRALKIGLPKLWEHWCVIWHIWWYNCTLETAPLSLPHAAKTPLPAACTPQEVPRADAAQSVPTRTCGIETTLRARILHAEIA